MSNFLIALNQYFGNVPAQVRPLRGWILTLVTLITIGLSSSLFLRFEIDATFDSWFDDNDPVIQALDDFRRQFGSDDSVFLVYEAKDGDVFSTESLTAVQKLTKTLEDRSLRTEEQFAPLNHIKRVQSLTNTRIQFNQGDTLRSEKLVPESIPEDQQALNQIRARAAQADNLELFMYSVNQRYGAVMIQTDFGAVPKSETLVVSEGSSSS